MTIRLSADGAIELAGICSSDEAETLLQHLLATPNATVDWRGCEAAHTAVIQVLMAATPKLLGPPAAVATRKMGAAIAGCYHAQMTQKVLIVDDSKLARMAVIKALNSLRPDWTRIEASNADEALALIKQRSAGHCPASTSTCPARTV